MSANETASHQTFKVTVKEKVTRYTAAYVRAANQAEADAWAGEAPDWLFEQEGEEDIWPEVSKIEVIDPAPDGVKVHVAKRKEHASGK